MNTIFTIGLSILGLILNAQNQPPVISNFTSSMQGNSFIYNFTLEDFENDICNIELNVFLKEGNKIYPVNSINATGDIGINFSGGLKTISWSPQVSGEYIAKIIVYDNHTFDIQQMIDQVDTSRLYKQLKWIEGIRHRNTGATHLKNVQDSIISLFNNYGLDTTVQSYKFSNYNLKNIVGNHFGAKEINHVYINDAHYDSVSNGPGADDNGTGVTGVMEIARIISAYHFEKTLRFIGFDLEEEGLIGSNAYVNKNGLSVTDTIDGVLNFEMIGYYSEKNNSQTLPTGFNLLFPEASAAVVADNYRGNFITNVGNVASKSLNTAFKEAASEFAPELKVISLDVPGTGTIVPDLRRSDHASFWDAGKPAVMLTDGANFRNKNYHTPSDKADSLNINFMSNVVKATMATMIKGAGIIHGDVHAENHLVMTSVNTLPETALGIYPNPFKNNLTLKTDIRNQDININIENLAGQIIYQTEVKNNNQNGINIPSKAWVSGVYLVTLKSGGGLITRKVVKE